MENENNVGLGFWLTLVTVFSVIFVGGVYMGKVVTHKQDQDAMYDQVKASIQDVVIKSYVEGFTDGLLTSKNFVKVGVAAWCNLDVSGKSLECNYNTENECLNYQQEHQYCVRNSLRPQQVVDELYGQDKR